MDFSSMSGWDFERYCADCLLKKGFTKAEVTSGSGDHGVDIIAEQNGIRFGIQCKLYQGQIPNKAVQEAYTGASYYDCDIAVIMSNSELTKQADEEARKLRVKFWNIADYIPREDSDKKPFIQCPRSMSEESNPTSYEEYVRIQRKREHELLLLEQLVNASEGNMRRLVHLLDLSMNAAFIRCYGKEKVKINDVIDALKKQGGEMESCYHEGDIDFLNRLVRVCRNRSTYRFSFPYKSTVLNRYTNKSAEYNIINICQAGTGRQGTVYSFDYVYCVYKDIPTHYIRGSEKLDKTRSNKTGEPIKRIAQLSEEIMIQADIRGKVEGSVVFLSDEGTSGSVRGDDGKDYFLLTQFLIESDRRKPIHTGSRIRFLPSLMPGNEASITLCTYIEILE